MKVRFFLRSKQVERSEIMLVVRHGTAGLNIRELRIQTGLHCKPNQWNVVQDKFNKKDRQRYNTIGCKQINAKLDVIEVKVHELIREARSLDIDPLAHIRSNIYTANVLESKYATSKIEIEKLKQQSVNSLLHLYDKFVTERENKIGTEFTKGTVKSLRSKYESMKNFLGRNGKGFKIHEINKEWFEEWKDYMFNTANLTNNTVEKHIKVLKSVLNWCHENGYISFTGYKNVLKTKGLATEADTIALTRNEVQALEELDLRDNKRLDEIRDLFLFEIYTSLRISDLKDFRPEHVLNGNILQKRSKKTSTMLQFYIKPKCKAILDKYNGCLPTYKVKLGKGSLISEQKANEYIKELCALIGLDNVKIERTRKKGTEIVKELIPKNEAVSNHTGRRTFATISLDAGYTERDVMRVTGHKDSKTLKKYDRPLLQQHDRDELRNWWSERGSV